MVSPLAGGYRTCADITSANVYHFHGSCSYFHQSACLLQDIFQGRLQLGAGVIDAFTFCGCDYGLVPRLCRLACLQRDTQFKTAARKIQSVNLDQVGIIKRLIRANPIMLVRAVYDSGASNIY